MSIRSLFRGPAKLLIVVALVRPAIMAGTQTLGEVVTEQEMVNVMILVLYSLLIAAAISIYGIQILRGTSHLKRSITHLEKERSAIKSLIYFKG